MIKALFKDGKEKCLTFSFDDGITQDRRLVEIFNSYGLRSTFNLCSGTFGKLNKAGGFKRDVTHNKIEAEEVRTLYKGHEVAVHTLTHPRLQYLSSEAIEYEIRQDRENLERLTGYPVLGMAYPFGTYNDIVIEQLRKCGIRYARTIESTKSFGMPQNFLKWHPTCHFNEDVRDGMINRFLNSENENCEQSLLKVLYIWGHSYEFDGNDNWDTLKNVCERLSDKTDIWYATNIEIVEYNDAVNSLSYTEDKKLVKNNSAASVWLKNDRGEVIEAKGGEITKID